MLSKGLLTCGVLTEKSTTPELRSKLKWTSFLCLNRIEKGSYPKKNTEVADSVTQLDSPFKRVIMLVLRLGLKLSIMIETATIGGTLL